MEPLLVILDIDETLIYASETQLEGKPDFTVGQYLVYRRPGGLEFFRTLLGSYRVAFWTSASASYASTVVGHIAPREAELEFVWTESKCTKRLDHESREYYLIKDLRRVRRAGYDLKRTVIVDDTPKTAERNYGNLIRVTPFRGHAGDTELQKLMEYLHWLNTQPNVRRVEKRGWQSMHDSPDS